jgi:hypothetical protein
MRAGGFYVPLSYYGLGRVALDFAKSLGLILYQGPAWKNNDGIGPLHAQKYQQTLC